jgi:uncharacterized protein YjbI with pentapeptide repeats
MADEKQLEILKQGVENWNQWRNNNNSFDLAGADLSGADLRGAIFVNGDLSETDFRGADLTDAVLSVVDLINADLRGATLSGTHFTAVNLSGADLTEANLVGADLDEVNLTGAHLRGAALWKADLWRVNLTGTDLTESRIGRTTFSYSDLSSSLGLKRIRHSGPSTVGLNTIRKSEGKIPIEFLQGCGLSDLDIAYAKLATSGLDPEQVAHITYEIHQLYCDQPIKFYSCFISYNSKDHKFAERLHDDLQNNGVRCWFAPEDLKIGDEFRRTIGKEIRLRDKLLIILSRNSIRSEWVGDEVEKALAEEKEQGTFKLFPIRLDDAVLKAKDDWAEKIRLRRHIGDFSKDYATAFNRLLRDLKPQRKDM